MKYLLVIQATIIFGMLLFCNNTFAQPARSPVLLEKPTAEDIYYRGTGAYYAKKYEVAILYFDRAISMNKEFYSRAHNKRGQCNFKLKKYEEARIDYDKAIEKSPQFGEAFNNRGELFLELKKYDQALNDLNKTIKLYPRSSEAFFNKGLV